jgi:hypothetical protein
MTFRYTDVEGRSAARTMAGAMLDRDLGDADFGSPVPWS